MTLAIVPQRGPVLPRATSSVPPTFGEARGPTKPYVIAEMLALLPPYDVQTRFYTSAYADRLGFKPLGLVRFRFPNSYSLKEVVEDLHGKLSAKKLENMLVPSHVGEETEFAVIQYVLRGGPGSNWFDGYFAQTFFAIFAAMVRQCGAVEITQR